MASFMSKKKKYKFQVDICLEELLEVPFVSAVLFAKMRLLDGGSFQDHSSRQEVRDHKVHWDANFSFPCKMMANASTGVMEKCILRISIRKECKGGRSFTKLGFVDLNLAEYAGAGLIHKKALLEGYDTRHRQDNSMLKFRIQLNMVSGDILFKAPSPSLKHKQLAVEDASTDQRSDDFSSGSLAGSIASGSSGFGSLPKKRTPLLSSELVIGQTLSEGLPPTTPSDPSGTDLAPPVSVHDQPSDAVGGGHAPEPGHSRNSSNTSQMSKASGYSSISHSRQSSSGESTAGHIRALQHDSLRRPPTKFLRTYTYPKHRLNIPTTIMSESPRPPNNYHSPDVFHTPQGSISSADSAPISNGQSEVFYTPQTEFVPSRKGSDQVNGLVRPRRYKTQQSDVSSEGEEIFRTPDGCFGDKRDVFSKNFNALQKSTSSSVVERMRNDFKMPNTLSLPKNDLDISPLTLNDKKNNNFLKPPVEGVFRSKSDFIIPKLSPDPPRRSFTNLFASFLTPRLGRKEIGAQSTPKKEGSGLVPPLSLPLSPKESRAVSMGNLKMGTDGHLTVPGQIQRLHRKMLLDCAPGKLAPVAPCSPPDAPPEDEGTAASDIQRRPSAVTLNPSSGSIAISETGSLDRAKAAYERRKKNPNAPEESGVVPGRVEVTRVNPEHFIAELLKSTNLEQGDDSAETSGLQLFIAKDGTASLGNHEVKSQMSTGVQSFKQVVMDDR